MTRFNDLEKKFSILLKRFPLFKLVCKRVYIIFSYILYKKDYDYHSKFIVNSIHSENETFFGYYDKLPHTNSGYILAHISSRHTTSLPSGEIPIEVALLSSSKKKIWSQNTFAYNWQQGSRLQWLDNTKFTFNDFCLKRKKYISKVVNLDNLYDTIDFDYPVQDSFNNYYLSLNYSRIYTLRPEYGYSNLSKLSSSSMKSLLYDGIWKIFYNSSNAVLLVSLSQICSVSPIPLFDRCLHKLNHIMISPDGLNCIFIHRYYHGRVRYDRLFLCDIEDGSLFLLSNYKMVSHCSWLNNSEIIGFMNGPNFKSGWWKVNVFTGEYTYLEFLSNYGDGHPTVSGKYFSFDSYPDKSSMQFLYLADLQSESVTQLGEFKHWTKYHDQTRCDLHPRLDIKKGCIYFDSVYTGKRQLHKLEL